jgi:glutaredoxin-like protein
MDIQLPNLEGHHVPNALFYCTRNGQTNVLLHSSDFFYNRTVIVFALPGAFTPTCSSSHLPRYEELAPVFYEYGVDEIACVSVNDAFVMEAWKKDQKANKVSMLADGNGEFTNAMGMLIDKSAIGFGKRSWRYSMLVKNGIIVKQFIEPNEPGDPFKVSDADTMLEYVAPTAAKPLDIVIFTKPGCSYCETAKQQLQQFKFAYEEIVLGETINMRGLRAVTGKNTVPQVFVDGNYIGGSVELKNWIDFKSNV